MLLPDESKSELDTSDDLEDIIFVLRVLTFRFENLSFVVRFKKKFFIWIKKRRPTVNIKITTKMLTNKETI